MPRTLTRRVSLPLYVTRFTCIGAACEDTCCGGWTVEVDKATFQAYRKVTTGPLAEGFRRHLQLAKGLKKADHSWGRFEQDVDAGTCKFLDEGMCSIQNHMGEDALCDTCYGYPRSTLEMGGEFIQSLTLSCPEAARLALLAEDAFELVEADIQTRNACIASASSYQGLSYQHMGDVRFFSFGILRTKQLAIWQRLAVLGLFCDSLTRLLGAGEGAQTGALVRQFEGVIERGKVIEALEPMTANYASQACLFAPMVRMGSRQSRSERQNSIQRAIGTGLGFDLQTWDVDEQTLISCYARGLDRLKEVLADIPHFFEHYLINDLVRDPFPFSSNTPMEDYLQLVSRYGIVRVMLAGRCAGDENAKVNDLVETIQFFSRRFQHDPQFAAQVYASLQSLGAASIDKLYGFLRN